MNFAFGILLTASLVETGRGAAAKGGVAASLAYGIGAWHWQVLQSSTSAMFARRAANFVNFRARRCALRLVENGRYPVAREGQSWRA
jgi:hypothetical protein